MCKCINTITSATEKHLKKEKGGKITNVQMLAVGFSLKLEGMLTYNDVEYLITSKKTDGSLGKPRKKTIAVYHSYCPFCGKKNNI